MAETLGCVRVGEHGSDRGDASRGRRDDEIQLEGGDTVPELPLRGPAPEWAAKLAMDCRCAQAVREFQRDPAS